MKILNVRLNPATNSSSTHSVILAGTAKYPEGDGTSFHWEWFLQESRESKLRYGIAQLDQALRRSVGDEVGKAAMRGLFAEDKDFDPACLQYEGGVDHDSEWTLPKDHAEKPLVSFFVELTKALADDPTVAIRGGNDNEEAPDGYGELHPRWGNSLKFIEEVHGRGLRARKQNGVWTLYNLSSGTKVHMKLDGELFDAATYRPETPELMDIKITDYCPFNCSFCYQDSTKEGKHGDVSSLGYSTGHASVLEVAFGGGEPTLHPKFAEIVEDFGRNGVTPNFTTKNPEWYKNTALVEAVKKYTTGYAVSLLSPRDVKTYRKLHQKAFPDYGGPKLTFQYVLDAFDFKSFTELLDELNPYWDQLTLLGYKSVGRGGKAPYRHEGWLEEILTRKERPAIAIDTAMVRNYEHILKKHEIPETLYYKEEGRFGMYFDAVTKQYGLSSYDGSLKSGDIYQALRAFKNQWQEQAC